MKAYLTTVKDTDGKVTLTVGFDTSEIEILKSVQRTVEKFQTEQAKYDGIQLLEYISVDRYEVPAEAKDYYEAELSKMDMNFTYLYFYDRYRMDSAVYVDGSDFRIKNRM